MGTMTTDAVSWANTRTQLWRYLADRTGVLAIANMTLLWAFAMRNNVLIWLTGWSFATFNQFHRWVARVATIEAILHSIGYTVEAFLGRSTHTSFLYPTTTSLTTTFRWGSSGILCRLGRKILVDGRHCEFLFAAATLLSGF